VTRLATTDSQPGPIWCKLAGIDATAMKIENGRTKPGQDTRKCSAPSSESPAGRQEMPWKRSNVTQRALEKMEYIYIDEY
jgi:hypothetical protein